MTALSYTPDYDERIDHKKITSEWLLSLTAREERVIRERFGFNCAPKTLAEIATEFDRSIDRIRQIEAKALRRLKGRVYRLKGNIRRCGTRAKVNFAGAGFGIATPRAEPKRCPYPQHWSRHYRLVGVINEMAAAGSTKHEISDRLVADYHAAPWMKQSHIWDVVPSLNAIAYIMKRGTLEY